MPQRKTATKAEKDVVEKMALAFIIEDIADNVDCFKKHGDFKEFMRKRFPREYRIFDEFQKVVPRVRKQLLEEIQKDKAKNG